MVQRDPSEITGSRRNILPAVIPAALLLLLTGAVRTYSFLTTIPGGSQSASAKPNKGVSPTEPTFAKYAAVMETLKKSDLQPLPRAEQEAALSRIIGLIHEPISMEGNTFRDPKLSNFSPETLLLSLTQALGKGAQKSAKSGDLVLARKYVDALYSIGDHVLSNPSPTVKGLESAHHFLGFAARVQASIFPKSDTNGASARYREWALTTMWKKQFSPRIGLGREPMEPKYDKRLATNLFREYRDGWSRIRAGEA